MKIEVKSKYSAKELNIIAHRIHKKSCPYCGGQNVFADFIARKATCKDCNISMGKEEGIKLMRRAEIHI